MVEVALSRRAMNGSSAEGGMATSPQFAAQQIAIVVCRHAALRADHSWLCVKAATSTILSLALSFVRWGHEWRRRDRGGTR